MTENPTPYNGKCIWTVTKPHSVRRIEELYTSHSYVLMRKPNVTFHLTIMPFRYFWHVVAETPELAKATADLIEDMEWVEDLLSFINGD